MTSSSTLSVSQFLADVNVGFDELFPGGVAVRGEVAEFHVSQNRWVWFKLKDEGAVVDCFMTVWDLERSGLSADVIDEGMMLVAEGGPSVFPKSGRFSLKVRRLKIDGEGSLKRAYERLKAKLEAEGVFAPERKRPCPAFPVRIGLIASRESAAYTDFLRILRERWPAAKVISAHVAVQGEAAVAGGVGAFRWFNAHPDAADLIVLTRGGGSMEDLQAFNSEPVVRAVFGSRLPVICAIGHERDVTLADLAADARAATPTHAAELAVPDREEVRARLQEARRRLRSGMLHGLDRIGATLARRVSRLDGLVRGRVSDLQRRLDAFASGSRRFVRSLAERRTVIARERLHLATVNLRRLALARERLGSRRRLLRSADPRRPLVLGYALVRSGGALVRSVRAVGAGDRVDVEVRDGTFGVVVAEAGERPKTRRERHDPAPTGNGTLF